MKLTLWLTLISPVLSTVVTVTVPAALPSNEPEWHEDGRFTSAVLNSTNTYRAQHEAKPLAWNKTLAQFADSYLDRNSCAFQHSGGPYGENLAIGYPNATASVEAWGDERSEYNFGHQGFSKATGHFTQLVWKNTTDVGCARKLCDGWYLVCEYWPVGNVKGEYEKSVEKQESGCPSVRAPMTFVILAMYMLL